jgi:cytidylate kinase
VALSREAGVDGAAVARDVGTRLGWPVYDNELLQRIAQDMGVRTSLLESVDERRVSWLEEAFGSFMEVPRISESTYVQHLVKTILALGAHGDCVIVGRGAPHILPPESALRVRLVAPLKDRISAVSRGQQISPEEAIRRLETIDRERNAFVQEHFFKDPADLRNYDLILNFGRFGIPGCAELIVDGVRYLQGHGTARAEAVPAR